MASPPSSGSRLGAAKLLGPEGPLARHLPVFEFREGQVEMADLVERTLQRGGNLMVEAGTGVGKSFAYLVPALRLGRKVVISTATKALQDQLYENDLPALQRILGTDVPVARLKGRANYLCKLEWSRFRDEGSGPDAGRLARWARTTRNGDRDSMPGVRRLGAFWGRIAASSDNCVGSRCDFYDECHLMRLRRKAHASRIVVVNHHLLVADLITREGDFGQVLPDYDHVVVDEAHRLEGAATHAYSTTLTSAAADRLIREADRFFSRHGPTLANPAGETKLLRFYRDCFAALEPRGVARERKLESGLPVEAQEAALAAVDQLTALRDRVSEAGHAARRRAAPGRDASHHPEVEADRLLHRLATLLAGLRTLLEFRADHVHWSTWGRTDASRGQRRASLWAGNGGAAKVPATWGREGARQGPLFVTAAPIDPAERLRPALFDARKACVLTSATLAVNGSFDFTVRELGVPEQVSQIVASPFVYPEQAGLFIPERLAHPNAPGFPKAAAAVVSRLIRASRGRALVLFSSWNNLNRIGQLVERRCPFPVLKQGTGGPANLLREFRSTPHAVLLGTRTFWEGVDVPGSALSLVVIDKIPFPVPTEPIHAARSRRATDETGSGFRDYSLPQAALTLKQGLGRLIRSREDQGLAAVLDSRLAQKSYGARIVRTLPDFRLITRLGEATRLLEQLP